MLTVRDDTFIAAPPEAVFAFLDQPERQPEFTPSLTESTLLERLDNGGSRVRYTYRLLGLQRSGEVRATDYAPPERIIWNLSGDLHGTIRWYLEPVEGGTRFTYAATYDVPGPSFLQPLLAPILRRINERELEELLARAKRLVEAGR
jgi:carbon monoxide dehydrogenase subunit G